jgi:hypothetical protein
MNYYSREDTLENSGVTYDASEMKIVFDYHIGQGKTIP